MVPPFLSHPIIIIQKYITNFSNYLRPEASSGGWSLPNPKNSCVAVQSAGNAVGIYADILYRRTYQCRICLSLCSNLIGSLVPPLYPAFHQFPHVDTTAAAIPPTPSILTIRIHLVNTKCTFRMRHVFTLYCFYLGNDRAALEPYCKQRCYPTKTRRSEIQND